MKKILCLTASILMAFFMLFVVVKSASLAAENAVEPWVNVTYDQDFNHISFTVVYSSGDEAGEYPFYFGDGSSTVLTGTANHISFPHDYAYNVGGIITYTQSLTVTGPGGWTPWTGLITIDDRPETEHYIYLPFIAKPEPFPSCSIDISSYDKNHFVFEVSWENAKDGVHTFYFGDGDESYTRQFYGVEGTGSTWHDYPYPGGYFQTEMDLFGGGSCSKEIYVYWP